MLVKLTEVCSLGSYSTTQKFILREVLVNPEHVIMIREETQMQRLNEMQDLVEGLSSTHRFSKLIVNRGTTGSEIVVVGDPVTVEKKLNIHTKTLLKG